jgi:hypothetical protein
VTLDPSLTHTALASAGSVDELFSQVVADGPPLNYGGDLEKPVLRPARAAKILSKERLS